MVHKLALIGFGTVGQGFVEILLRRGADIARRHGIEFVVVAISDAVKGSIYCPHGLDLADVMTAMEETGTLHHYPDGPLVIRGWDSLQTIRESNAQTILEATVTNVRDGEPGLTHCREALSRGKNVVTTNKGPIALAYDELSQLADRQQCRLLFEGTVMSGTPVLRLVNTALVGNHIRSIRGILNGTSNFILSQMEVGLTFDEALQEAQRRGYAEADPTADVDGWDAQLKTLILARTLLGASIDRTAIPCKGIRTISPRDIMAAKQRETRFKLIARIDATSHGIRASVGPEEVALTDPLAGIAGAVNAITFDGDLAGSVTVVGAGAGRVETGYALLVDCINLVRGTI
ncbi:MAG: homoserine dehydrogenase [Sulfobacillus benefaciens]|uniref:Homoserine dehydrogenase n=1 Tax=Sulfobacillus benefaciens TaxID=453960 RepID=A0A2T2XDA4_9FIRM|nr:MAG: homoserine dehydrogenase [Sulfobacillus benefaciens]